MVFYSSLLSTWMLLFSHCLVFGNEYPPPPKNEITLQPENILVHHPVSTKNEQAQLFFDQGLSAYYGFNHDLSFWSFQKAAELDPSLGMAYWGMALSLGPDLNLSKMHQKHDLENATIDLIQKASQLAVNATPSEREYMQAFSTKYSNDPSADPKKLKRTYYEAMKALKEKYPDDPDAGTLFADSAMDIDPWHHWNDKGEPSKEASEALTTLLDVIKKVPNHVGANHLYIHLIEDSLHPERGLMAAERLRRIPTSLGHILHMPAHIYILVGYYHEASLVNQKAIAADKAYIKNFGAEGNYPFDYLTHNLYFLSRTLSMEGRFSESFQTAKELAGLYEPHFGKEPDEEYYISTPLTIALRFQQWEKILSLPQPSAEMKFATIFWLFGRASAFAALGRFEESLEQQKQMEEMIKEIPPETLYVSLNCTKIFPILQNLLQAQIDESKGNLSSAIANVQNAIGQQDSLGNIETIDWSFNSREYLGALFLKTKKQVEAEKVFREDLDNHPLNGISLYGLFQSLTAQSKFIDAYWIEQEFKNAWQYSDKELDVSRLIFRSSMSSQNNES